MVFIGEASFASRIPIFIPLYIAKSVPKSDKIVKCIDNRYLQIVGVQWQFVTLTFWQAKQVCFVRYCQLDTNGGWLNILEILYIEISLGYTKTRRAGFVPFGIICALFGPFWYRF